MGGDVGIASQQTSSDGTHRTPWTQCRPPARVERSGESPQVECQIPGPACRTVKAGASHRPPASARQEMNATTGHHQNDQRHDEPPGRIHAPPSLQWDSGSAGRRRVAARPATAPGRVRAPRRACGHVRTGSVAGRHAIADMAGTGERHGKRPDRYARRGPRPRGPDHRRCCGGEPARHTDRARRHRALRRLLAPAPS